MSNSNLENRTLIISAFEISDRPFPSELPIGSPLWNIFYEGYEGSAEVSHFGWLDLVKLRYLVKKCGITTLIVQGLDTLGRAGIMNERILVCNAYNNGNSILHEMPNFGVENCKPMYDTRFLLVSGWDFMVDEIDDLPIRAKWFMRYLLMNTGVEEVVYLDNNISVKAVYTASKRVDFITQKA